METMFGDDFFADFPFPFGGGFGNFGRRRGESRQRALTGGPAASAQQQQQSVQPYQDIGNMMMIPGNSNIFNPSNIFRDMEELMQQTASMNERMIGMTNDSTNDQLVRNGDGVFHSQVMVMSQSRGADGQIHTRRYAHSDRGDMNRRVREVREAFHDSEAAEERAMHFRQLGERAHRVHKRRDVRSGHIDTTDEVRGFERGQTPAFDSDWNQQAVPHLPRNRLPTRQYELNNNNDGRQQQRALPPVSLQVAETPYAGQQTPYVVEEPIEEVQRQSTSNQITTTSPIVTSPTIRPSHHATTYNRAATPTTQPQTTAPAPYSSSAQPAVYTYTSPAGGTTNPAADGYRRGPTPSGHRWFAHRN